MRIFIYLMILSLSVSASYEKASLLYEKGEFDKALQELKVSTSEFSNPKLHLLWAKSAEAKGDKDDAMSAYERVLILNKDDAGAKLKLLEIYIETSRNSLAKKMQDDLLKEKLSDTQKHSLTTMNLEVKQTLKVSLKIQTGYDTNVNSSASSDILDDFYNITSSDGELSSLFVKANASLNYFHELKEDGGWYGQGDVNLYYQNNLDAQKYNMLMSGLEGGVGYRWNNYNFYIPLGFDNVQYLDVNLFNSIKISPKMKVIFNSFVLSLKAKYSKRIYAEDIYTNMNDSSLQYNAKLYYIQGKNNFYFSSGYENFSADENNHFSYIDKNALLVSLGLKYMIDEKYSTNLSYRYKSTNYDDTVAVVNEKRKDAYNQIELKVSRVVFDNLNIFVSNKYIDNSSNYKPSNYAKNVLAFGLFTKY